MTEQVNCNKSRYQTLESHLYIPPFDGLLYKMLMIVCEPETVAESYAAMFVGAVMKGHLFIILNLIQTII